jgi:hypothetical protein
MTCGTPAPRRRSAGSWPPPTPNCRSAPGRGPISAVPALAGSMSQTAQPVPCGMRVTAKMVTAWVVPLVLTMTW